MMKYFWVTLLYLAFALVNVAVTQAPRVTTPLGEIEGSILTTRLGKPIFSFRNIRYAKPPVGDLRFRVISALFNQFQSEEMKKVCAIYYCYSRIDLKPKDKL